MRKGSHILISLNGVSSLQQSRPVVLDDSKFLDFLVAENLLDAAAARRAMTASLEAGTTVERTLMEFGLIGEDPLYRALAKHIDWPFVPADEFDTALAQRLGLPFDFLTRSEIAPVCENTRGIVLAMSDPRATDALDGIAFHLDAAVSPAIATPASIKSALRLAAPKEEDKSENVSTADIERLTALANDGPVIKLVNDLIAEAADVGASDIHIEAGETNSVIRFRIDGDLVTHEALSATSYASAVSRLKVMAGLNISEKRRPQDGRTFLSVRGRTIDIRLSTLPTQHGESVVLRLLDRTQVRLDWAALGYAPDQVARIRNAVMQPNGVFLVAGPTGSGKTTTLYTALGDLNSNERKIITVEDPIEYTLAGVNQVQVDTEIELSFARALRSILRQDPDVIMVGEIRDEETAEIAIRAALVGRMVLTTIHTNDAVSAITRLRDLGVPPYLLAATLRGVLSQRLVRKICSDCQGAGCDSCKHTGQRGRTALIEYLEITPALTQAITQDATTSELAQAASKSGFVPMSENADVLVANGITSRQEALRLVGS